MQTMTLFLVLLVLIDAWPAHAEQISITLDGADKYNVTWSFDGTAQNDFVEFTVTCETTGWVGIGLSPNGAMGGADIVVAWVDASRKSYIQDMYAEANGAPSLDESQDITLISASEQSGVTTFTFKRKINTCDEKDNKITNSTTRLIYAYGSADPTDNIITGSDYHGANRGSKSIYLLDPRPAVNSLPDDVLTFDMVVDDVEIPSDETTYYCKFIEPPTLTSKHHIVAIEPVVHTGNEGVVHHIVIYTCHNISNEHLVNNNKTEGKCFTNEMPEFFGSCRTILYAWAIGGTKFYFPQNTGFPIGTDDSPKYYLMEMHYDNQNKVVGRKDFSGIRLSYTPTLREVDSATVTIGNIYGLFVPPEAEKFSISAFCHETCTQQWIPAEGINIFGYMLHAHLAGVGMRVEAFRAGKPLGIIARDDAYDFNYQEERTFRDHVKILPGDTLKINCTFTGKGRSGVTLGGESSSAEMCLAFLSYYPKQEVSSCQTLPGWVMSADDPVYTALNVTPVVANYGVNYWQSMYSVSDWSSSIVSNAQQKVDVATHYSTCTKPGEVPFENSQFAAVDGTLYPFIEVKDDICGFDDDDGVNKEVNDNAAMGRYPQDINMTILFSIMYSCILLH